MNKWKKIVKFAKSDATLVAIVRETVAANKRGEYGSAGYMAFRDRAEEIGVTVPNAAYWSILFGSLIS